MSPLPANFTKCAIEECVNPCYVDDEGKVHECCGFIHAMEHQRRLAIMKRMTLLYMNEYHIITPPNINCWKCDYYTIIVLFVHILQR